MDWLAHRDCFCHLTSTLPQCPAHSQLFNTFPRLGALLRLHRPVLSKIEEVRTILRTLLEARRPPLPHGGPRQSYVDALLQQGQVWTGPGRHQRWGWGWCWRPQFTGEELRKAPSYLLGVSVSSCMRLAPESTWSGH